MPNTFYKKNKGDKIWWVETDEIGVHEFSFDGEKIYNLFQDYPHNLTQAERELFDRENPFWADFFRRK